MKLPSPPGVLLLRRPPEALVAVGGDFAPRNAHHVAAHHQHIAHVAGVGIGDALLGFVVRPGLVVVSGFHDGGVARRDPDPVDAEAGRAVVVVLAQKGEGL